jgi:hypothetical protein
MTIFINDLARCIRMRNWEESKISGNEGEHEIPCIDRKD